MLRLCSLATIGSLLRLRIRTPGLFRLAPLCPPLLRGPAPPGSRLFSLWFDLLAVCLLIALTVCLFRMHIFCQSIYIGNPDRLCGHLKILKFHADGLARGHLDAWSDFEMMGYDSFAMPYTFPNALTYLTSWNGVDHLYMTAGFISAALLALAGIAAYSFLRGLTGARLASLIGAILYEFSALTVLKVSQNDMSFAVFILIPLMALVVRHTDQERLGWRFSQLALLVFVLLHFMFLQKAAYALMLLGCYALYRGVREHDWRPPAVFAAAVFTGAVAAFPRVWGVAVAMGQYTRQIPGVNLHHFEDVYRYQHILPYQVLRWFDDSIFGRCPSESTTVLDNNVNLTEGFLLYTSSFVPFLLILGLFRYRHRWLRLPFAGRGDASFFFWFFAFTIAVLTVKPVHHLLFVLFLRMDFTHARILVAGLLCLSALVTLLLADLVPASWRSLSPRRKAAVAVGAAVLAALVLGAVEAAAHRWKGHWQPIGNWRAALPLGLTPPSPRLSSQKLRALPPEVKPLVSQQALARIVASGLAVLGLLAGIRLGRRRPLLACASYGALAVVLPVQALLAADFRVNGPQTAPSAVAFVDGNNYRADRSEFSPPGAAATAALAGRLQRDQYRCVLLPAAAAPWGFAGGHVPEFWQLRAVDGYYGLGVPARLAALPWPQGVGLRTISFRGPDLPWPLLGLLNVKFALVVDQALFANAAGAGRTVRAIKNPAPVMPRCFFARSVEPVASAREAAARLFEGGRPADVRERSFVEGLPGPGAFACGDVCLRGGGDWLEIIFAPSDRERFLVVNDLFFPGWRAEAAGRAVPIYPTNAVMRGILVPAGAGSVVLTYVPFVRSRWALPFYGAGLALFVAGALLFRRAGARRAAVVAPAEEGTGPQVARSA
jgi:hypothetical protein